VISFNRIIGVLLGYVRRGGTSSSISRTYGPGLAVVTSTGAGDLG
jgi:hypothetical protein